MRRIPYDKLVRDRIPEIVEAGGSRAVVRIAAPDELRPLLERKLREELDELCAPGARRAEELADLLEVLHALARLEGLEPAQLEDLRARKADERGGFERGIVLDAVEQP